MPAQLIPDGAEMHFHGAEPAMPSEGQHKVVVNFLDDLENRAKKIRRIL
jgi:hypothetical protein